MRGGFEPISRADYQITRTFMDEIVSRGILLHVHLCELATPIAVKPNQKAKIKDDLPELSILRMLERQNKKRRTTNTPIENQR